MDDSKAQPKVRHHTLDLSMNIGAIVVSLFLWAVVPSFRARLSVLILAAIGLVYLSYRSHWARKLNDKKKRLVAAALVLLAAVLGVSQLWPQWERERANRVQNEVHAAKDATPLSTVSSQQAIAAPHDAETSGSTSAPTRALQMKKRAETRSSPAAGPKIGNESTVLGNIPSGTEVGDKSVFVGATDANGNAILNHPGAYGYDAHAGTGSIAVGAHAGTNSQPTYQLTCTDGSACAQGEHSQATVNNFGVPYPHPPEISVVTHPTSQVNPDAHDSSGMQVYLVLLGDFQNPGLKINCNVPCQVLQPSFRKGEYSESRSSDYTIGRRSDRLSSIIRYTASFLPRGTEIQFEVVPFQTSDDLKVDVMPYVPH